MPSRSTIAAQNTQNPFIWDACCLLNLAATRREATILSTLGQSTNQSSWVVREVLEGETLTIRPYPKDPQQIPTPVDLSPLIQANVLSVIDLDIDEEKLFITIAQTLDDGESRTLAVAVHRGFSVLTDDRPHVATNSNAISSSECLHHARLGKTVGRPSKSTRYSSSRSHRADSSLQSLRS